MDAAGGVGGGVGEGEGGGGGGKQGHKVREAAKAAALPTFPSAAPNCSELQLLQPPRSKVRDAAASTTHLKIFTQKPPRQVCFTSWQRPSISGKILEIGKCKTTHMFTPCANVH